MAQDAADGCAYGTDVYEPLSVNISEPLSKGMRPSGGGNSGSKRLIEGEEGHAI